MDHRNANRATGDGAVRQHGFPLRRKSALHSQIPNQLQEPVMEPGINNNSCRCSVGDFATDNTDGRPDPRLVFLERAAARLILVEACALDLEEAIEGLVHAFHSLISRGPA